MTGPRLPPDHRLMRAVFGDVPHDITAERIVIIQDRSQPGNALAQLHDRLVRYLNDPGASTDQGWNEPKPS